MQIRGKRLCEICATKEFGDDLKEIVDNECTGYIFSDAKFKCPAYNKEGSCKSTEVHYSKFYMGSCCEPASKVLVKNKKGKSILFLTGFE